MIGGSGHRSLRHNRDAEEQYQSDRRNDHAAITASRGATRLLPPAKFCAGSANYAGPAWCPILMPGADAASRSREEQIMMNPVTAGRGVARLPYAAVRLPFTLLDERVVARDWHDQGLFRLGFQRFLGSADELPGWLLADDDISGWGQALTRTWRLAVAGAPATGAQARPPQAGPARRGQASPSTGRPAPDE